MNTKPMFSSATPEWSTPSDFFQTYDSIYHFDLDPACTHANAKCEKHYTIAEDGLSQNWGGGVSGMAQSPIRQRNREVGTESLSGRTEGQYPCGMPTPGPDRYGMVPRLLQTRQD